MDQTEKSSQTFEYGGMHVTVFFSNEGKTLQDCMVDILKIYLERQSQS